MMDLGSRSAARKTGAATGAYAMGGPAGPAIEGVATMVSKHLPLPFPEANYDAAERYFLSHFFCCGIAIIMLEGEWYLTACPNGRVEIDKRVVKCAGEHPAPHG